MMTIVSDNSDAAFSHQQQATKIIGPFQRFFRKIVQGSYPLFLATVIALIWANSFPHSYHDVWHKAFSITLDPFHMERSLVHWIGEALMSIFFFTVFSLQWDWKLSESFLWGVSLRPDRPYSPSPLPSAG